MKDDMRELIEVRMMAGMCGHHFKEGCTSCASAKECTDRELDRLRSALSAALDGGWLPLDRAPYNTPVEIKAGHMTFLARLLSDASMTHDEQSCDQWVAEHEGEHPPCWSGGACWEVNEEEAASLQPTAWRALPENNQ